MPPPMLAHVRHVYYPEGDVVRGGATIVEMAAQSNKENKQIEHRKGYINAIRIYRHGVMGRPMVLNLLKAGHQVTIYARHPDKARGAGGFAAGAHQAPSPRAMAIASEMVITMLPNSPQVEEVVAGSKGFSKAHAKA